MEQKSNSLTANQLLTKEDLHEFEQKLLQNLKEFVKNNAEQKKWLKSSEVLQLLKISPTTLFNLRVRGTLKASKIGNITYFSYDEIHQLMINSQKNKGR